MPRPPRTPPFPPPPPLSLPPPPSGGGYDALYVGDVEAVARGAITVDVHVEVAPAGETFGKRGGHACDLPYRALHLPRQPVDDLKIGAGDLDPHRAQIGRASCRERV